MKRHMKKFITIALSMSMMQPTLQAGPFQDFARKWVARGAAVGYWGLLGNQVLDARTIYGNTNQLRANINGQSIDQSSLFPTLAEYAPLKAARIDAILKKENISGLQGYNVKVLTNKGISKFASESLLMLVSSDLSPDVMNSKLEDLKFQAQTLATIHNHGSPCCAGDKTLVVPEPWLDRMDPLALAAVLTHEKEHAIQRGSEEQALLHAGMPFAIHAACKGMYHAFFGTSKDVPTITRSLLRIPRAGAVLGASYLAQQMFARERERRADKALQKSSALCRATAHLFRGIDNKGRRELALAEKWESLDKAIQAIMTKDQYVAFMMSAINSMSSHPSNQERIAYLEKWAQDAEAKQNKNK